MTDARYRLHVIPATGEFEIEGSEEFVEKYWEELQSLINSAPAPSEPQTSASPPAVPAPKPNGQDRLPQTFGEYLNLFSALTGVDQVLVAGHFQQATNSERVFTTKEANDLLKEQSVKVSNASECVRQNVQGKKVFKVTARKYRISQPGEKYIKELLELANLTA